MALPGDTLSTTPVPGRPIGARALPVTGRVDYLDGPLAVGDTSQGLEHQRWRCRVDGDHVKLQASCVPEYVWQTRAGLSEVSATFDQNARPWVAYVAGGTAYLYWFDATVPGYVDFELPAGTVNPRLLLDDPRPQNLANSDVILAYVRDGGLYYRQQRERFEVERLLLADVPAGLIKLARSDQLRVEFHLEPM
jgi:hypothetical protein